MKEAKLSEGAYVYIYEGRLQHDNLPSWEITHLVVPTENSIDIVSIEDFVSKNIREPYKPCAIRPFMIITYGHTKEEVYELIKDEQERIESEILKVGAKQVVLLYWSPPLAYECDNGKSEFFGDAECFMIGMK